MMKKILAGILCLAMLASLAACGQQTTTPAATEVVSTTAGVDDISSNDLLSLFADMTDLGLGSFQQVELDQELAAFVIGAQEFPGEFQEGYALMPMMNTTPFVLAVFRLAEGADTQSFAANLENAANPEKWICVRADHVESRTSGNTVLFFMCPEDFVAPLNQCFDEITADGFVVADHLVDPLKDLSMNDLYQQLFETFSAENYGFMDGADMAALTGAMPNDGYGLQQLDTALFTDSLLDDGYVPADEESGERAYVLAMFRLSEGSDAKSFAQSVSEVLSAAQLQGENSQHITVYSQDVVISYTGTDLYGISATALQTVLTGDYRMHSDLT